MMHLCSDLRLAPLNVWFHFSVFLSIVINTGIPYSQPITRTSLNIECWTVCFIAVE